MNSDRETEAPLPFAAISCPIMLNVMLLCFTMDSMTTNRFNSLDEYEKRVNALIENGFFTFRGQCCSSWSLEPGIIRKVKRTYTGIGQSGLLFRLSVDHVMDLIKKARENKYINSDECDLNIIAILQHYGAATPLLDFSNNPLVALYFACQPCEENGLGTDGKVFCINYSAQIRSKTSPLRPVTDPFRVNIESALEDASRYIWYWQPTDDLCRRSERQESVFVFGWGLYWKYDTEKLIDELDILVISAENKKDFLRELKAKYNISEVTLFPDVYGFAQSNSHMKLIDHFSAEDFYQKGEEEWSNGSPEWAAEYYRMAYTKNSDWTDARCKCALALNWSGEQDRALKIIDLSIAALGKRWQFIACKSIIDQMVNSNWKSQMREAEKIASDLKQEQEFRAFVYKYSDISYD